jgi:hypothetical protein
MCLFPFIVFSAGPDEAKNPSGEKLLRLIQIPLTTLSFPGFALFGNTQNYVRMLLSVATILRYKEPTETRSMSPPDQRSLKALASLKLTPREAEVLS